MKHISLVQKAEAMAMLTTQSQGKTPERTRKERLTTILMNYWKAIKKEMAFPAEEDVNPAEIKDIWDCCFIVEANNFMMVKDFFYKYLGDGIRSAYLKDLSGHSLDHVVAPKIEKLASEYERVLATKAPVYQEGSIPLKNGKVIKFRQVLLPLGDDGVNITSIMGGFSYKIYS